jgi:hypothetical protein
VRTNFSRRSRVATTMPTAGSSISDRRARPDPGVRLAVGRVAAK